MDTAFRWSRALFLHFGISWSFFTGVAVLHLQFAGFSFIVGSGFRLLELRKHVSQRIDNAA